MNNYMLVVDDLSINRDVLCNMFSKKYDMLKASTGEEAVALAKEYEGQIALVLLDIQLPGITGLDILRMRQRGEILVNVPVIVITIAEDPKIQLETFRLGAMDYINKPFIREIVEYRVANASLRTAYKDLNQAAEEKEQALRAAEQASQAKSRFLTRISHELRTPMNAIIGLTGLLKEKPDDYEKLLDSLDISAHHLLELLNEMMDISEIENGDVKLKTDSVVIQDFLGSVDNEFSVLSAGKNIRYHTQITEKIGDETYIFDQKKLKKVLTCLLDNAMKFTPFGGNIYCSAKKSQTDSGDVYLSFGVRDTGVGISEDFLPLVFDEFETEFDTNTTSFGGVGLGLSICKSTVEMMGGSITAESEKGVGSTFTVKIPVTEIKKVRTRKHFSANDSFDLSGKNILVVDDNEINRIITVRLLERCKARAYTVVNGKEAVDFFETSDKNFIDAVLMDIRMPVLDGLDAAKAIRSLDRDDAKTTPIIAVTANSYPEDVKKSLDAGMNAHLSKPVEPELLCRTLCEFIFGDGQKK